MSIKRLLIQNTILLIIVLMALFATQYYFNLKQKEELDTKQIADRITYEMSDLILLSNEYQTFNYTRIVKQWKIKYSKVKELMYRNPEINRVLNEQIMDLNTNFSELIEIKKLRNEHPDEFRQNEQKQLRKEWLFARNQILSRSILTEVRTISASAMNHMFEFQQTRSTISISLILLVSIIAIASSYRLIRKISIPLNTLDLGIKQVEKGIFSFSFDPEHAHKSLKRTADTHQIGQAFNAMLTTINDYIDKLNNELEKNRQYSHKLKENEERYRSLFENAPNPIYIDFNTQIILPNKAFLDLIGARSEEEVMGMSPFDVFHPDYHEQIESRIKKMIDKGNPVPLVHEQIIRFDKKVIDVEVTAAPFTYQGKRAIHVVMRDVTDERMQKHKLEEYRKSLQDLTTELSVVEEKQRKEIAANIHDHLSQSLVISKMKLKDVMKQSGIEALKTEMQTVLDLISQAINNSRKITYDLSPTVLYELGLVEAVYWLKDKVEEENDIDVAFTPYEEEPEIPESQLILLFRTIQELINNTLKHASADKIEIMFKNQKEGLEIRIIDNGKGFDVKELKMMRKEKSGFGLFAVRERVENMRGTFHIDSKPGAGTSVTIYLPL
ncbi:MAG: PAS domain-containing sensor histidine kinase [Bacteroidales bacterium]|nr:PAS domain-containing sensor histidine kinase [Bacteroidales bacterium]